MDNEFKDLKELDYINISNDLYIKIINKLNENSINHIKYLRQDLYEYLDYTNNLKYLNFILNIIRLDEYTNPNNYSNLNYVLTKIHLGKFNTNRSYYIKKFKENLETNNLLLALQYLEIIGDLEDLKQEHNLYKHLKKQLIEKNSLNEFEPEDENTFLKNKLVALKNKKGVVLINTSSDEERLKIHNHIKNVPNIDSITIEVLGQKKVMLAYVSQFDKNSQNLYQKAHKLYNENDYKNTIIMLKQLIDEGKKDHTIFSFIGLCYLKANKYKSALDYFETAYAYATEEMKINNYLPIIEMIQKKLFEKDQKRNKRKVISSSNEKEYIEEKYKDIFYMIFEEKINLSEILKQYNFSENEQNIIKLIYAKEEYRNMNYETGDMIVKIVEKSKDKSKEVKELLNEIRKNKNFYKNRPEQSIKLSLKPKS